MLLSLGAKSEVQGVWSPRMGCEAQSYLVLSLTLISLFHFISCKILIFSFLFVFEGDCDPVLHQVDLVFRCRRVVFEWEGFGLESFQNDTSLSLSLSISLSLSLCGGDRVTIRIGVTIFNHKKFWLVRYKQKLVWVVPIRCLKSIFYIVERGVCNLT